MRKIGVFKKYKFMFIASLTLCLMGCTAEAINAILKGGSTTAQSPPPLVTPEKIIGSLSGTVQDSETNKLINGAKVRIGNKTVTTDSSGFYELTQLEPGEYKIIVSNDGYESLSDTVNVSSKIVKDLSLTRIEKQSTKNPSAPSPSPLPPSPPVTVTQVVNVSNPISISNPQTTTTNVVNQQAQAQSPEQTKTISSDIPTPTSTPVTIPIQASRELTDLEHNFRGNDYFYEGSYDLAIEEYTKAIQLNPNNARAYINRGNTYYKQGGFLNCPQVWSDWKTACNLRTKDSAGLAACAYVCHNKTILSPQL